MRSALLIPYYGKWPVYFNLYLESCRYNPWIDFVFITDLAPPAQTPDNVKFKSLTLEELRKRVDERLNIRARLNYPYKLCDLRPAYGLLFVDYLKAYDYWGWGDIDVIYGDLKKFLPDNFSNGNYDVISFRARWVSGAFTLLRNSEELNTLFLSDRDYITVFESDEHFSYGECGKRWNELRAGAEISSLHFDRSNMTLLVRKKEAEGNLKCSFNDHIREYLLPTELLTWSKGRLFLGDKELMMYHFISEKKSGLFEYPQWSEVPDTYHIDRLGFLKSLRNYRWSWPFTFIRRKSGYWLNRIAHAPGR